MQAGITLTWGNCDSVRSVVMAILQACCCWRSVRTGSYASAIYTAGYFAVTVLIMAHFVHSEYLYWQGNHTVPQSSSFLEPETISHTTMAFNMLLLCCSSLGVITSFLLIYGIYRDKRALLVPWILTVLLTLFLDLTHSVYLFVLQTTKFNPLTAMLFTLDFFLLCLNITSPRRWQRRKLPKACNQTSNSPVGSKRNYNTVFLCVLRSPDCGCLPVYSLLCVISQYQEYKAGRGTAEDGAFRRRNVPQVKYTPRATATTCLSSRRPTAYDTTLSPTGQHSNLLQPEDPNRSPANLQQLEVPHHRPSIKRVQFPDQSKDDPIPSTPTSEAEAVSGEADSGAVVLVIREPWAADGAKMPANLNSGVETAPLIDLGPQLKTGLKRSK